jgi:hypothetical protein
MLAATEVSSVVNVTVSVSVNVCLLLPGSITIILSPKLSRLILLVEIPNSVAIPVIDIFDVGIAIT